MVYPSEWTDPRFEITDLTLFVSRLPMKYVTSAEVLKSAFRKVCDSVVCVRVLMNESQGKTGPKSCCFVTLSSKADFDRFLHDGEVPIFNAMSVVGLPTDKGGKTPQMHKNGDRVYKRSDPVSTRPPPLDSTKVAIVQGFPPDATASDIQTYFTSFGNVTSVEFTLSESGKVAKVAFSDPSLVGVMVTMAKTGSLTMGEEAVLHIEHAVDYERRLAGGSMPTKRERDNSAVAAVNDDEMDLKVFIGGISRHAGDTATTEFVKKFGNPFEVINTGNGYSFVKFHTAFAMQSFIDKINGQELCGKRLEARRAEITKPKEQFLPAPLPATLLHPCLVQFGSCRFGDMCSHALVCGDVCVHWLNGRCHNTTESCKYRHKKFVGTPTICIAVGKHDYAGRVTAMYQRYEPSKVGNVQTLLETYAGQEDAMMDAMVTKYGAEPTAVVELATPLLDTVPSVPEAKKKELERSPPRRRKDSRSPPRKERRNSRSPKRRKDSRSPLPRDREDVPLQQKGSPERKVPQHTIHYRGDDRDRRGVSTKENASERKECHEKKDRPIPREGRVDRNRQEKNEHSMPKYGEDVPLQRKECQEIKNRPIPSPQAAKRPIAGSKPIAAMTTAELQAAFRDAGLEKFSHVLMAQDIDGSVFVDISAEELNQLLPNLTFGGRQKILRLQKTDG